MAASKNITIKIGAINTASRVMRQVSRDAARMGASVGGGLASAGGAASRFGRNLSIAGGLGVFAFAKMTKTFASFDDGMKAVQAITRSSGKDFEALTAKAKELGSTTKFTATEAAEGMKFLAMAGFSTQEVLDGIGPTLSLAAAGAVELGEAADIASDVGTAFGIAAKDIGRVADVIAQAATSANTDVLMMSETMKHVAPIAMKAGQSLEEVSAAVGLLGNAGVKAGIAGTDLKNILTNMATTNAQKKLKEMGVTVLDAQGEFLPLMDIMASFEKQTASMTGPQKLAVAVDIFGKRSAKSALILGSANEQVDEMRTKMMNAKGAADEMAATMISGLGGAGTLLKSAFEGLSIAIISGLKEPMLAAARAIQRFLQNATAFAEKNPTIIKVIAAFTIGITGLGIALMTLGGILGIASVAVTAFGAVAGAVGTMLNIVWSPITLIVGAVLLSFVALAAQMAVVAGVLTYIAAQGGVLTAAFEHLKAAFVSIMATIKQTFAGIGNALEAGQYMLAAKILFAGLRVVFWDGLSRLLAAFQELVPMMWNVVKKFLVDWLTATAATALDVLAAISSPLNAARIIGSRVTKLMAVGLGANGGIPKVIADQRDAAQTELDKLTDQAAQAAADAAAKSADAVADVPVKLPPAPVATPEDLASMIPDVPAAALDEALANSALDEAIAKNFVDGIEGVDMDSLMQNIKDGLQIVDEGAAGNGAGGDGKGDGSKTEDDPAKTVQQQSLTASGGRLITTGRAADPVLEEQKKQTEVLADIAKNTAPRQQDAGTFQPMNNMSFEMIG